MNFYASTQRHNHLRKKSHNLKWNGSKNTYELKTSRGLISIFSMTRTREQNTTNSGIHHCRLMTRSWSPHATLLFNLGPLQTQQHPLQVNQCSKHPHQPVQTSEHPRWYHGLPLQNSWSLPNGCMYVWSHELADVIYILDVYVKGIITIIMYFHCCIPGYSHNRYDRFFWRSCAKTMRSNLDLGPN